jgi:RNA polymerase sigma factor (sigma-70 family)
VADIIWQMPEPDDISLLKRYAGGDESAFAALFERHVHLVYSAALRQTRNPSHAEEVTQSVFILLARKAKSLHPKTVLSGWLYQAARLTTASLIKREIRRQRREQEVYMQTLTEPDTSLWEQISPLLDDAMGRLGEKDRNAIVLRFFENRTPPEVAATLKLNEATARKRVSRALEKLRTFFARRGVVLTTAVIAGTISGNSVQAAPAALANSATAIAIAKGAMAGGSTLTLVKGALKIMAWTKTKAIVTAALVATVSAGIFEAHQAAQLRTQNQTLQQQQASLTAQIQQLSQSLADATNQLTGLLAENARVKANSNENELLKLRGQVTQLRTANAQNHSNDPTEEAAKDVATRAKRLKQWLEQNPNKNIPELQNLTAQDWLRGANYSGDLKTDDDLNRALSQLRRDAKRTFAYSIGEALANYVAGNNGQLPGDISQLASWFNPPIDGTILQRYQLLQTGNLSDIPNNEPLIAEKAPVDDQYDSLFKISATDFSYQGTGTAWVNGSGKGNFGTNITAKIKPFERR